MPKPENIVKHRFKKGETGNPHGRPVGAQSRSTIARRVLDAMVNLPKDTKTVTTILKFFPGLEDKLTANELMNIVQATKAMTGDTQAYRAIQDSAFGAPKQEIETSESVKITGITFDDTD